MANSKYEHVRKYELDDELLPGCYIVIRVDGKGFTKFSTLHNFEKPNDINALLLMDEAAKAVLVDYPDIRIAFGQSDEYSFVLHKNTAIYGRRSSKLVSLITSCFTSNYVRFWPQVMGEDRALKCSPTFDGRAVLYPSEELVKDYLSWRQVDTHINNQYNTCFWALVQQGNKTPAQAQEELRGSDAEFKNELLYSQFGINYNTLPEQFKKGSVVVMQRRKVVVKMTESGVPVEREKTEPTVLHCDIIRTEAGAFWAQNPDLLK
ncbi:hypothetical protein CEUSTIGMA_g2442.t1 [Chlamydomonas eustigma]|uniref:tRNA(His) guanylyltransferase n=1 Tax=Chlamydomonas eustigma TaxID=1157962 RepID=A0A250WW52_9CHLO|nr:hypothetical protein CEUSTIGMA_g2442.t1 [Chlamydomonas eustigma]|eukprot:GAX74996.1 hypothetical protein CEUSTIGMA_g2442.t1 [Chlamydomonas eustigma]